MRTKVPTFNLHFSFHFISFIHHHQAGKDIEVVRIFFFSFSGKERRPRLTLRRERNENLKKNKQNLDLGLTGN